MCECIQVFIKIRVAGMFDWFQKTISILPTARCTHHPPQARTRAQHAVGAAPAYRLMISLLVGDERVHGVDWDIEAGIQSNLGPLLEAWRGLAELDVVSQVLYQAQLDSDRVKVKRDAQGGTYVTAEDVRLFVNPTEWTLHTTDGTTVLHLLLYVPR